MNIYKTNKSINNNSNSNNNEKQQTQRESEIAPESRIKDMGLPKSPVKMEQFYAIYDNDSKIKSRKLLLLLQWVEPSRKYFISNFQLTVVMVFVSERRGAGVRKINRKREKENYGQAKCSVSSISWFFNHFRAFSQAKAASNLIHSNVNNNLHRL